MKKSCVSLFTGAGGMDIGFIAEGYTVLSCVECDRACVETLRAAAENKEKVIHHGSVDDPKVLEAVKADLNGEPIFVVAGGPPCQAFSTAGKRGAVGDPRGTLIFQFMRWVKELNPEWFVFENVRGLVSAAMRHRPIKDRPGPRNKDAKPVDPDECPGSVIQALLGELPRKFRMDAYLLNAADYGVPQFRERVLFIGNRLGKKVERPPATHGPGLSPYRTLKQAIWRIRNSPGEGLRFSERQQGVLKDIPPGGNWRCLDRERAELTMKGAYKAGGGKTGWWRRLAWDQPSPTILTQPNHSSTCLCHPDLPGARPLSLRECALIQQFPHKYPFQGTLNQKYRQVGNAVPVGLARAVARAILKAVPAEDGRPQFYSDMTRTAPKYRKSTK